MTVGDPFAHLRARFAQRCRADAGRLRDLARDDPAMMETVHRLSGSAGTFGFSELSKAAEALEGQLREEGPIAAELEILLELLETVQAD